MAKLKFQKKAIHRQDGRGGQYTMLPNNVYDSPAYQAMSLRGRGVLQSVLRRFNGYNNGLITCAAREFQKEQGEAHYRYIKQGLAEAVAAGLLVAERRHAKTTRKATEWRLTFISSGPEGKTLDATNDYLNTDIEVVKTARYKSKAKRKTGNGKKSSVDNRSTESPLRVDHGSTNRKKSVDHRSTANKKNSAKPPNFPTASVDTCSTHIVSHVRGSDGGAVMPCHELRSFTKCYLEQAGYGAQTRLANDAQINAGTLNKFLHRDNSLPEGQGIRLQLAVGKAWPLDERPEIPPWLDGGNLSKPESHLPPKGKNGYSGDAAASDAFFKEKLALLCDNKNSRVLKKIAGEVGMSVVDLKRAHNVGGFISAPKQAAILFAMRRSAA